MQQDATLDFFVLAGDANRDAVVNQQDLQILASHWQQTGMLFSDGDFNYDGTVDISDLAILATNWQANLPGPAPSLRRPMVQPPRRMAQSVFAEPAIGLID